ncbi:hypothetical protein EHS25_004848 [Saitozyma podzolica]|uniref:Nickel/cobalt efflux system n=1 Tax=Saitozyma podzolica TaxID=1890683 RepID=A0A427Y2X8_9TREE|nr:hypothetical protein EHS25_004848 [Saitozyma podzolica]
MVFPLFGHFRQKWLALLGRAAALITGELLAHAAVGAAAVITLSHAGELLGLALPAWTIGLCHARDADNISAIDNATRQLSKFRARPLVFAWSLNQVIAVNVAIAFRSFHCAFGARSPANPLSVEIYKKLDVDARDIAAIQGGGCPVRFVGPVLRAVDRPWKMYSVGVLFGFGFDTASSIALLAISAIDQRGPDGEGIKHCKIVIFLFLFTAGMCLMDSLGSVLMLYAYAPLRRESEERKLALFFNPKGSLASETSHESEEVPVVLEEKSRSSPGKSALPDASEQAQDTSQDNTPLRGDYRTGRMLDAKASTMSSLSITLTVICILVALRRVEGHISECPTSPSLAHEPRSQRLATSLISVASLVEIMGMVDDNCSQCQDSANDPDGGGLAGSWWRFWDAIPDVYADQMLT